MRALVERDAERRSRECSSEAEDDAGIDVQLVVLGPHEALAIVHTPCDRALSGAYNHTGSVMLVRAGHVSPARFAPLPSWAGSELGAEPEIWNPALRRRGSELLLEMRMLDRGIGDSGTAWAYRWEGSRFVLIETRGRDGGAAFADETGPWPILGPPARACGPVLQVLEGGRARLMALHGSARSEHDFPLQDTGCAGTSDTLDCSGDVSYTTVARADAWVVLRVHGEDQREVARIARRCSLE